MSDETLPVEDLIPPGEPLSPSKVSFPVVGIGASAGGLPALLKLFELMPADNGMAFVVVLHLSPHHTSNADALLQNVTRMPVVQVGESTPIEPNHIYVIPPTKLLAMDDGHLRLSDYPRPYGRHVAIDLFFRTLALVHRERAIAVVLTGTGSDGAVGISQIKEQGGVTLAQSPADAEFDGMPRAAVATGMVDWTLPVVDIPQKLVELWANARNIELPLNPEDESEIGIQAETPPSVDAREAAEDALRDIVMTLRVRTGHDFRHYKRATVLRRLERRMQVCGVSTLPAYRDLLHEDADEPQALLKDLLIGVTNFFRDREAFEALEREVLPQILPEDSSSRDPVRVWVTACASGEEAYSVAMLLQEQLQRLPSPRELQIFATDIDESAIAVARSAAYTESIVTDVPPSRLRQFFSQENGYFRVRKEVREKMLFAEHNLLRDPPFSRLDLITCRNLLIYLEREVQTEILEMFHFALRPGGYLFLGSSESADAVSQLFSVVDKKNRIFRANAVVREGRGLPMLPLGATRRRSAAPIASPSERRRAGFGEVHQQLLEQYAPPSMLIDGESNIVHLSETAGRFLRHGGGAPSHNLMALIQPELRLELRTALFQALQTNQSVEARRVQIERDGRVSYVNIIVRPVPQTESHDRLVLVLFDEVEHTLGEERAMVPSDRDPVVVHLEDELRRTKEQLQATIEQTETSTEELKASNEELQAINEELRSATEELETSKEELQSINEELITVNQELKLKVDETGKVNDDLQNLIASTDIATIFIDRGMNIKRYTPRATEIFSIIPTDIGRSLLDITHRLDYESLSDDAAEAFQSLQLIEREVQGGNDRWYLARLLPYRTIEDRIDGAVLTFIDITGRRLAEERLREQQERMRLVAESTKDHAIVTLDTERRITGWNLGAENIFGYSEAEAKGQLSDIMFTDEDRELGQPVAEIERARADGACSDDRWHQRRDGSRFYCSGITTPMYDRGVLVGFAKIARDLTGTKRAEAEREAQLERERLRRTEAQAASALKDEFLAVMSHELKNPLNLIHLNAELLSRLPEARGLPAVARSAEIIRKTVQSQAKIIDDLLDLSRINTGKLSLSRQPVDWPVAIGPIIGALSEEAAAKKVAFDVRLPDEQLLVDADPVRLEQIVWNLLTNAIKFTPAGGQVALRMYREDGRGVLEVRDSGRGIDPASLDLVFQMFEQKDATGSRFGRGLGIGLALVRHLVMLHGGDVTAHSDGQDCGSTFTVRLPLKDGSALTDEGGAEAPARRLRGLRTLVVDDEDENAEALRSLLELEGVHVTTAGSAQEALRLLANEQFDLLVSDIAMPGMDGYDFIHEVRRNPATAALPAVALTGFGRPADAHRALVAGFHDHLSKPVTLDRLSRVLLTILGRDG